MMEGGVGFQVPSAQAVQSFDWVLARIPHQPPFRFIDTIHRLDAESALSSYRFREDEYFYKGHFPDRPVTPGVILTEAMCQMGGAPIGIFLASQDPRYQNRNSLFVLADSTTEFMRPVFPGTTVYCEARRIFWRLGKLKVAHTLRDVQGRVLAMGEASGMLAVLQQGSA